MYVTTLDEMNGNAKPFLFSTAIAVNEEKHLKLVGHYYDLKYVTSMTFFEKLFIFLVPEILYVAQMSER